MRKTICLLLLVIASFSESRAQEIQARFTVIASRISSEVNKNIFNTLQSSLTNFVNNRKWSKEEFLPNEKILCNFLLNIDQDLGNNMFKARLTVQAARPIYNSTYESPLINFIDNEVVFKYQEYQPVEFNENRVQGNDAGVANLPAVLAYYINIISDLIMHLIHFAEEMLIFKKPGTSLTMHRKARILQVGNHLKVCVIVIGWPKI